MENGQKLLRLRKENKGDTKLDSVYSQLTKETFILFLRRQLLDDDQRDIKLLQERFLEDGELHAEGGREKNFRWQNINSAALEAWSQRRDSDDEEPQEEEEGNEQSEELWRKMRAERDAFFKKMKKVSGYLRQPRMIQHAETFACSSVFIELIALLCCPLIKFCIIAIEGESMGYQKRSEFKHHDLFPNQNFILNTIRARKIIESNSRPRY